MKIYDIHPSAARLIGSLRDIGYDFNTAVADLVDNSISADATHIQIDIRFSGEKSAISITDDGCGMTESGITEALRFGTLRDYADDDLGRYGLGLKTASLSQCRRVTVVSRRSLKQQRIVARQLDLDWIERTNRWGVSEPERLGNIDRAAHRLRHGPGTTVVWEQLDRIFGGVGPDSAWAKRRLSKLAGNLSEYLGMVFHRFLAGEVSARPAVHISVNGDKVLPWDPFAPDEATATMVPLHWELSSSAGLRTVTLRRFVLPPRDAFSSPDEFERLAGPLKWNRQQGLYIYRSDRLIQSGGWAGIRTSDEHTKLARASLDFPASLDEKFHVNVAKMRVSVPSEVRTMLEAPVNELCREADRTYRSSALHGQDVEDRRPDRRSKSIEGAGLAVRAAAMVAGITQDQMDKFGAHLRHSHPEVAATLGM